MNKKIPDEHKEHLDLASRYLKNNRVEEAEKELKWIEASDKVREKSASWAARNKWSILIGLICIIFISIGLTFRIPSAKVTIELSARSATLHLVQPWQMAGLVSDSFYIDHLRQLNAPGLDISIIQQEPFYLSIEGKNIKLDTLSFSSGADITFNIIRDKLTLYVNNDSLFGNLDFNTGRAITPLFDTLINVSVDETFSFATGKAATEQLKMEFADTSQIAFRGFKAKNVGFSEETHPGSGVFESTVLGGTISIYETGKKTDLQIGDILKLGRLKCYRLDVLKQKDILKIHMQATTTILEAGPEFYIENLKPTFLEYIYYQQTLAFIFSSALFLWGLLWSLKNSLFK